MFIDRLTVTGADESVDPKDLYELSINFPFVEFGILLSKSREGKQPCFPGVDWMYDFYLTKTRFEAENDKRFNTSCHICGEWAKDLINGGNLFLEDRGGWFNRFNRMQINTGGKIFTHNDDGYVDNLFKITSNPDTKIRNVIVQIDGYNDRLYGVCFGNFLPAFPLFDSSYGNGKSPEQWHQPMVESKYVVYGKEFEGPIFSPYVGYAGGLNPDNLETEIEKIRQICDASHQGDESNYGKSIWLDMQSGVRSNDGKIFDLKKVEACLEIVEHDRQQIHST